jgi:MerR family transcriptional regulator/heat shock protein HspR
MTDGKDVFDAGSLAFVICHLASAIRHLSSAIRHLSSAMLGSRNRVPNRARSAMTRPIISREIAARQLAVTPKALVRYEKLGLVQVAHDGKLEGYEPSQVRRLWTIMSFQRDLGINLAGVEVILRLCDRMTEVHHHLDDLASEIREILDARADAEGSPHSPHPRSQIHD